MSRRKNKKKAKIIQLSTAYGEVNDKESLYPDYLKPIPDGQFHWIPQDEEPTLDEQQLQYFKNRLITHLEPEPVFTPLKPPFLFNKNQVLEIAMHAFSKGVEQGLEVDFPTPYDSANFLKYILEYIDNEY